MPPQPGNSPDSQILGLLLVLQSSILGMEDERQISELIGRGLSRVPGVLDARLAVAAEELSIPRQPSDVLLPVRTPQREYGALVLALDDSEPFAPYLPFVRNIANVVALYLENRRQRRDLQVRGELASKRSAQLEEINRDLHTEIAARDRAEKALRFLVNAGGTLSESLDQESTLARLSHWVVPELADHFLIDLVDEGHARRFSGASGPAPQGGHRALQGPLRPALEAMRTRAPCVHHDLGEGDLSQMASDSADARVLAPLELRDLVAVPLIARDRVIGSLTLASRTPGRYGALELDLVLELARRAAAAVDNAELYRQTQEAVRARDEFLSIATHDLRGALGTVQLAAETLRGAVSSRAAGAVPAEEVVSKAERVIQQVARLERLLEQLLDVSRISAGRLELELEVLDLSEVVCEVVARSREAADKARSSIELRVDRPIPGLWDRLRLEQLVANLVSNAIKYGAGAPIEVEARSSGELALLRVRDRGVGIAQSDQVRLFRRFERAAGQRGTKGAGLGLWIVRQIAEAFGGTVELESELGHGAQFTVRLPRGPTGQVEVSPGAVVLH